MSQPDRSPKQHPALLELDTLHLTRYGGSPKIYIKTDNYWYKFFYLSETLAKNALHQLQAGFRSLDVVLYNTDTKEGSKYG